MQRTPPGGRTQRSAFAAAFFSFLFPGLGQAYLGLWRRAVAWALLPILLMVSTAFVALSQDRTELLAIFSDPTVLLATLGAVALDLLYRLLCVLDAWRQAGQPDSRSSGFGRAASAAGLVAVILVLFASHVAVAQPVYIAYDLLASVTDGGDDTEVTDIADLRDDPNFADIVIPGVNDPSASPSPVVADPSDPAVTRPTRAPTAQPEATATIPPKYEWDGKKRLDILLVGADAGRAGYEGYLTDTMMVVSVEPRTGRVAFISLPRDTVDVPLPRNWGASRAYGGAYPYKINTLYTAARAAPSLFPGNDKERGFEALKGALSELLGLDIRYHVAVDLSGFREVVNTLGGVVVDVQLPVQDEAYPADDGRGKLKLYIPPGLQYMGGGKALGYARSRHATSDFDRAARQQRVITSVREQTDLSELFRPGVLDKLVRSVKKNIKTDIPPNMLPKLVALAQEVDLDRRISLVLSAPTFGSICYPCPPNGQWAIRASVGRMRAAAQNVFKGDQKAEARRQQIEGEGAVVEVLNGSRSSNIKTTRIAEALAARGVNAVVPPVNGGRADSNDHKGTVITVYNGGEDQFPETVKALQRTFKAKVKKVDDASVSADIVIVVGSNTPELSA